MRVHRYLITLTTLVTLAALTACAPYGRPARDGAVVAVGWDSGPLDRSYSRERADMDVRHNQEIASPRADETSDQRTQRQAAEDKDLATRYAQAKASHSDTLPPSAP